MRKFGLIGYPLGHSFSQKYFSEKFLNEHIPDCSYSNYPIDDINQFAKLINVESDLCGLNVTIPYKSEIFRFLDYIDPEAHEIGAVNVIKFKKVENKTLLIGYNSDVTGVRVSLLPYINENLKSAIVLGSGGSSKSVCFVLKKLGLNVNQISRVRKPGMLIYSDIDQALIENTDLIVNTTPLGMFPKIDEKPDINYNLLTANHILFDLVYNPELTSFLRMGIKKGCKTISGLKMLHAQADKAWQIWNDDKI
jgi:shikimate dehydrogenase